MGFSYQKNFFNPTLPVDEAQFFALVRATKWNEAIDKFRETGNQKLKRGLPAFIFQATFDETQSKKGKVGRWRKQAATRLTGLVVMDVDHLGPTPDPIPEQSSPTRCLSRAGGENNMMLEPRELFEKWQKEQPELFGHPSRTGVDGGRLLLIYITPSGKGLKIVFKARTDWGNLIDNQHQMAKLLGVEVDESCKDASRMSFICKESDILYIDKELFTYENKEFAEKYDEQYREGRSAPTHPQPLPNGRGVGVGSYHGIPYSQIVEAWLGDNKVEPGDRHRTSLVLADHLRYITDNDPVLIEQILRETPFVKEIIEERGEDVATTVKSAQGYEFLKGIPKRMQQALQKVNYTITMFAT